MSKSTQSTFTSLADIIAEFGYRSKEAFQARSDASGLDCSHDTHLLKCPDEKVHQAQQNAADEHNIVNLVDKLVNYGIGAEMPVPIEGGIISGADFHELQNQLARTRDEFLELPAHVRARFNNDPAQFLDFFYDEKNADEAAKLGFIVPKEADKVIKVDVVDTVDRRASLALKKAKEEAGEV